MLLSLAWFLAISALVALFVFGLGVLATLRHTGAEPTVWPREALPPVSLLKPLKGLEEGLGDNLRSFYAQDYPRFEIVFCATEHDDEAWPLAKEIAAEFPHIHTQFVISDPSFGLNPKVANLAGALAAARYDLVLQSDANVRAQSDYVQRLVSDMLANDAHLVSSLVSGIGEESLGAAMHNLQLTAFIAPACCFALHYFKVPCVIGKSMLFRKRDLEEVGGLASVRDILAEDYMLGRAFQRHGKGIVLSTTVAENLNVHATVEHFLSRHARWLKMRAVIHVPAFVIDLFANPVALGFCAWLLSGFSLGYGLLFGGILVLKNFADAFLVQRVRGRPLAWRHRLMAPMRDFLIFALWPYAAISRSVQWRGSRLRMGWNSKLRPDTGPLPIRMMRRLFYDATRT